MTCWMLRWVTAQPKIAVISSLRGAGSNIILGNEALFRANGGITVSYDNVEGSGGVTVTRAANGSATVQSRTAGVVNDTITFLGTRFGTHEADRFVGQQSGEAAGIALWLGFQGDDTIIGGIGNDGGGSGITVTFTGEGSGTAIDGFGDTDTLSGIASTAATFALNPDGSLQVTSSAGTDRVHADVETLDFTDLDLSHSEGIARVAGMTVYRGAAVGNAMGAGAESAVYLGLADADWITPGAGDGGDGVDMVSFFDAPARAMI